MKQTEKTTLFEEFLHIALLSMQAPRPVLPHQKRNQKTPNPTVIIATLLKKTKNR